jgi:hypothetical protein
MDAGRKGEIRELTLTVPDVEIVIETVRRGKPNEPRHDAVTVSLRASEHHRLEPIRTRHVSRRVLSEYYSQLTFLGLMSGK